MVQGYELLERIGSGGFGAVHRAFQSTIGREVAVKIILPIYANHPEFIRRFEREAQLIARLEHLHIVPLYDYWRDPEGAYIVMRWLRGGSLADALQKGAFELEPSSLLLDQVAAGLAAAHHRQVVHRDLKPSNILLDEEGNAYLSDFGIAADLGGIQEALKRETGAAVPEETGESPVAGSLQYMSPEQLQGGQPSPQSDIYSLGVTLYEVLAGEHPFPGLNTVQQLFKHIDEPLPEIDSLPAEATNGVNAVIQKATAKNPNRRYQDALEMAAAFREAVQLNQNGRAPDLAEALTRREHEILHLITDGKTNQEIAQALFLELSTVKWHVNRIYKKLNVRSRVQAIVRARELDLILSSREIEKGPEPANKTSTSLFLPEPTNPYKGLRSFESADHRHFFGREALVEHLLERLNPTNAGSPTRSALGLAKNGAERFLAIVGPSGSGKSSLVKAGLIPALWSGQLEGSDKWFIVDMLPGARPLESLEIALTRIAADQAGNLRAHLDRDNHGLARAARLILPRDESELLLVIDQFEELFTLVTDETARNRFMDLIQESVDDPGSRVRVIITLRADYYDRPLQYPAFGKLIQSHVETLLPLSAEELERAIVNPAHHTGMTFEPGLVATIIEEVNYRPGALPLLQYALAELFEQRAGRTLTHSAYVDLGGAAGALTRRAEELYQEQDADVRETIRQMFLRLVSIGDQAPGIASEAPSPADTRRRVLRSELLSAAGVPDRLDEIIDTYADYRLLSLDHNPATRQGTVEIAHEAILREWDRLQTWLEESRVDLSLHHQLVRATAEWNEAGGDQSFLLRGTRLDRFESWANDTQLVLTLDERNFLATSVAFSQERAAAERKRQERETSLERQSNRRLKALVVVMAAALLAAIGLASAALSFAQRVEQQRQLVEAKDRLRVVQELTSAARTNLELDPELSLLLALEAAETTYFIDGTVHPQVQDILYQAVQRDRVHLSVPWGGVSTFSPDEKILAIGSQSGVVRFFDLTMGQYARKGIWHPPNIGDMAFSPAGRLLATVNDGSSVYVWDITSSQKRGEILDTSAINALAFAPDGQQLATAGADGVVRIWDLARVLNWTQDDAEPVQLSEFTSILRAPGEVVDVAYSPDGGLLAALLPGENIILIDAASGRQLRAIGGVGYLPIGVSFSPDGHYVASSSNARTVTIWDARTDEEVLTVEETSIISVFAFSPDGRYLATGTESGTTTVWKIATGEIYLRLYGHSTRIIGLSFNPESGQLATSGEDRTTRIWDLEPASGALFTIAAHQGEAHDAIFSPDGTLIASAGEDGTVKLWDAVTEQMLHNLPGQMDWVHFPAFNPEGDRLAAANRESGVSIWDVRTGRELLTLYGDASAYTAIVFSPDGSQIAAGGKDGFAHIWDAGTGEMMTDLSHDGATIMELIFTHGGDQIQSFDSVGVRVTWNAVTGERLESSSGAPTYRDVELSRDGRLKAMACSEAYVQAISGEIDGTDLHVLGSGEGEITGVAFNPQGNVLATSSTNGLAELWDMDTGAEIATLFEHTSSLGGVDFSPDGRYILTAGADGTVSKFAMSMDELMEIARSRLSRGFTLEECRQYGVSACVED